MDYDDYLLNMYVIDLAPVTAQEWFQDDIRDATVALGSAGGLSAMGEFGVTKALEYYIYPWGAKIKAYEPTADAFVNEQINYLNSVSGVSFAGTAIN